MRKVVSRCGTIEMPERVGDYPALETAPVEVHVEGRHDSGHDLSYAVERVGLKGP